VYCQYGILLGFPAVIIDKNVPHDRIKPSLDIRPNIVFILIGQSAVQGLLKRSFAASESRVSVIANGFKNSALLTKS